MLLCLKDENIYFDIHKNTLETNIKNNWLLSGKKRKNEADQRKGGSELIFF